MTTLPTPDSALWIPSDLRAWRGRLGWTQLRAAEALCFHLQAYKKLEGGTRGIGPRVRRLCLLTEREHVRAMFSASGTPGSRQVFATAERVLERLAALEAEGKLVGRDGKRRLTYVSLFSGIEACSAAFERIGSDALPLAFAETDPAANAVLRYLHPDVPRTGSVLDTDWAALRGHVDIVAGGPPCQSFSRAGKSLGLADPRGNLTLHFLRAVDAMRPRYWVFENVPGLLSSNDGRDFETFLQAVADLGVYHLGWRILDAKHWLPQRRARLWVVGHLAGSSRGPQQILDLGEGKGWNPRAGKAAWKRAAQDTPGRTGDLSDPERDWSELQAWLEVQSPRPELLASPAAFVSGDVLAFQPMAGVGAGTIGAAVNQTPTLGAVSGGNRVPAVVYAADLRPGSENGKSQGTERSVLVFKPNAGAASGIAASVDHSPTLAAVSRPPAVVYAADLRHGTVGQEMATLQVGPQSGWSLNASACAVTDTVLRRLSPLECLRLQGIDDADWLENVRLGGRPLTDTDKYRLIGNSWAVPAAAWVLERLLAYEAEGRQRSPRHDVSTSSRD